jgi:anaerobic magnesium-protoporphyrin IX monomethyl ester cyclase
VDRFDPQVVAFTSVSSQFPFICRVAERVKCARPGAFLIIGGPHVSLNPEEAIGSVFNAVCIGEGEYPMLELARQLEAGRQPSSIQNLWLRQADGTIQRNPTRPFLEDLDALPVLDRDIWQPWIASADVSAPAILLGRGCPYLCTYCCNHGLRKLADGKYVRLRSPAAIVEEVKRVRERYLGQGSYIYLEIETIGVYREWTLALCAALQRFNSSLPQPIKFHANYRVTTKTLDPEVFRALREANFCRLNIGLEAGSERVRREVLKRNYTNAQFLRAVALAREHGLEVNLFNMVGLPGETLADHLETVRLNREARPHLSYTSIFFPYPGTELYQRCRQQGLLDQGVDVRRERQQAALDLPQFSRGSIQRAYDLFDWRIHKGDWPWHVRLRKLLRLYILKSKTADRVFLALLPLWKRLCAAGRINRSFGRNT